MTGVEKVDMSCCKIQAGKIAEHMESQNIEEQDVSWKNQRDEDWKTEGEMTGVEKVDMSCCKIQAGKIAEHMESQNIEEQDVSWKNQRDEDWKRERDNRG
eukprot:jgi/Antlo1/684/1142